MYASTPRRREEKSIQMTERLEQDTHAFEHVKKAVKKDKAKTNRLTHACETGTWLSIMPDGYNGTVLTGDEFQDSLHIRYGLNPKGLQDRCDGCSDKFCVGRALSCKKGGLITMRHDDVKAEWQSLCAKALSSLACTDEPSIHNGLSTPEKKNQSTDPLPELRGDVSVRNFWKRGQEAIFDVRITDTEAKSYCGQDPDKILARHEKEKKNIMKL